MRGEYYGIVNLKRNTREGGGSSSSSFFLILIKTQIRNWMKEETESSRLEWRNERRFFNYTPSYNISLLCFRETAVVSSDSLSVVSQRTHETPMSVMSESAFRASSRLLLSSQTFSRDQHFFFFFLSERFASHSQVRQVLLRKESFESGNQRQKGKMNFLHDHPHSSKNFSLVVQL